MKNLLFVFASGALFALGLGISGMTHPTRVLAFLDVGGAWDPTLAFVMGGAVGVYALLRRFIIRRPTPLFDTRFHLPTARGIDGPLLGGAALFGVGWGLSGYCPGPAFVSLVQFSPETLWFVAAMLGGMAMVNTWRVPASQHEAAPPLPLNSSEGRETCG